MWLSYQKYSVVVVDVSVTKTWQHLKQQCQNEECKQKLTQEAREKCSLVLCNHDVCLSYESTAHDCKHFCENMEECLNALGDDEIKDHGRQLAQLPGHYCQTNLTNQNNQQQNNQQQNKI